jgi:hypothetical protein
MATLHVNAGSETESLLQAILDGLEEGEDGLEGDNAEVEITRESKPTTGVAGDPITIAATITLATILVPRVARIIERWMENQRQAEELRVVAAGFASSDEAGKELAKVAVAHSKVSIEYKLEQSPKSK